MIGHFHWGNDDFKKKQQNNEGTLQEQFLNQLESNSGIILLVFSLCRWCFGSLMELSMAREWKSHFLRERMRNSHEHGVRKDPMQKKNPEKTNKQAKITCWTCESDGGGGSNGEGACDVSVTLGANSAIARKRKKKEEK